MKDIVLLGAPGAGKGTQAEKIAERYNVPHISTGDIFRANMKAGTEVGLQVKAYVDSGRLVPDELTIKMVEARLCESDAENGFVLDGFPRTLPQASALDDCLKSMSREVLVALNIHVDDDVIIKRLAGRRLCKSCGAPYHLSFNPPAVSGLCDKCGGELITRVDDAEETVKDRLRIYHEQTSPLIGYYKERGKLAEALGQELVEDTTKATIYAIEKALGNNSESKTV